MPGLSGAMRLCASARCDGVGPSGLRAKAATKLALQAAAGRRGARARARSKAVTAGRDRLLSPARGVGGVVGRDLWEECGGLAVGAPQPRRVIVGESAGGLPVGRGLLEERVAIAQAPPVGPLGEVAAEPVKEAGRGHRDVRRRCGG